MATDITGLQFNEEGFKTLKAEVQALVELVGYMSHELTPAQKANVIAKQKAAILTPQDIEKISGTRLWEEQTSVENAVRIKRMLA